MRRAWNPWLLLAGAVVIIDAVALRTSRSTLTSAFRGALRHPVRRWPVLAAWALVSSHLLAGRP